MELARAEKRRPPATWQMKGVTIGRPLQPEGMIARSDREVAGPPVGDRAVESEPCERGGGTAPRHPPRQTDVTDRLCAEPRIELTARTVQFVLDGALVIGLPLCLRVEVGRRNL